MADITLFEFRNEVVGATCKCSLCLPLGPAGLPFHVETPNAKFTLAFRMFAPLQLMSGKAQAPSGFLEPWVCLKLSGIWEKLRRKPPKPPFLILIITATREKKKKCPLAKVWLASPAPHRCAGRAQDKAGAPVPGGLRRKPPGTSLQSSGLSHLNQKLLSDGNASHVCLE